MVHKKTRPPTRKKGKNPTVPPPLVSYGTNEMRLLRYLYKLNGKLFNRRAYSRSSAIPRTTIKDTIDRLIIKGFLCKPDKYKHIVTTKGENLIKELEGGVGSSRRGGRVQVENLSTHYHQFKLEISERKKFSIEKLNSLNPINISENRLHNLHQIMVYFEDATILINPKKLIISLKDIISADTTESTFKSMSLAIEYAKKFMGVGIITEGMYIEQAHFARIESIFSDMLEKIDDKYFIDLGQGKKFWIDHSGGKREDETNDKIVREKVDNLFKDISDSDYRFKDISEIVDALEYLTKIEALRFKRKVEESNMLKKIEDIKPDYIH